MMQSTSARKGTKEMPLQPPEGEKPLDHGMRVELDSQLSSLGSWITILRAHLAENPGLTEGQLMDLVHEVRTASSVFSDTIGEYQITGVLHTAS